jgi:hypothetical protein
MLVTWLIINIRNRTTFDSRYLKVNEGNVESEILDLDITVSAKCKVRKCVPLSAAPCYSLCGEYLNGL